MALMFVLILELQVEKKVFATSHMRFSLKKQREETNNNKKKSKTTKQIGKATNTKNINSNWDEIYFNYKTNCDNQLTSFKCS